MLILEITKQNIEKAVQTISEGGVVVFPTETAYGLAADATNRKAIEKIFKIKGRGVNKFLPLICASLDQAKKYFRFSVKELQLARKYWPGDLTLVLRVSNKGPQSRELYLLDGQNDCGVRVSSNEIARRLSKGASIPITATSANVSGGEICYSVEEVVKQFQNNKFKPDVILDGGKLKKRKPSTIVKFVGDKMEILRQGEIRFNKQ